MGRVRTVVPLGVLCFAVVLASGAGAATQAAASQKATDVRAHKIDVSTTAKIHRYLRSIGVNPRTVVIQRGKRNYAGPHCPGKGWNCTRATRVLQAGGQNEFECPVAGTNTPGMQICKVVLQSGDRNEFRCVERTTVTPAVQECTVAQQGETNIAVIEQFVYQTTGTDQEAKQNAEVTQNLARKNDVDIKQMVEQRSTAVSGMQSQDAYQLADVVQSATGTIGNFAHVHQGQDQRMQGAATTQLQNTVADATNDCAASNPVAPNECAFVQQTTDDGVNNGHIHHALFEDMKTTAMATNQQQGIDPGTGSAGGLEGTFEQLVTGSGTNTQHGNQTKNLRVSAGPGSAAPKQFDEARCCGVSATGGRNGTSHVTQHAALSAPDGALQFVHLRGESDVEPFNPYFSFLNANQDTTGGGCHITSHGRVNGDSSGGSASAKAPCTEILLTECVEGECETFEPTCTECVTGSLVTLIPTTPTSGLPLSDDIFGEPSDFTGSFLPLMSLRR